MLFQTYYRLDPWEFEPKLYDLRPIVIGDAPKTFSIRYENPIDEDLDPVLHVLMTCDLDVPVELTPVFSKGGNWRIGTKESFPAGYEPFLTDACKKLDRFATAAFNQLRWRIGIMGGPVRLMSEWIGMLWQNPNEARHKDGFLSSQVPFGGKTLSLDWGTVTIPKNCSVRMVQPLGHSLLREAWNNRENSPQSALVIGIAAAEVGFKEAVSDLLPATTWLMDHVPSPPLDKMLREFMETLPARQTISGAVCRPPKSVISAIKQGIELRNEVVHRKAEELDDVVIQKTLNAVRDLLYLLDYYRGETWALEQISPGVLADLNSPRPAR